MLRKSIILLTAVFLVLDASVSVRASVLEMDSLAARGRFPAFCIRAYRAVDRFLNDVDTSYVGPTGYDMNVKLRTKSWSDMTGFYFDGNRRIQLRSPFTNLLGVDVQWLGLAVGYDINVNRLFGGDDRSNSRFDLGLTTSRISARFYYYRNNDGMDITSWGDNRKVKIGFDGVDMLTWGIDAVYVFDHRRYSMAASSSFGRIQRRSKGSFLAGLTYQWQELDVDFGKMPGYIGEWLPDQWRGRRYIADGYNVGIAGGYGYNWVPRRNITVGVQGLVIPSLNYGYLNSDSKGVSFRMNYRFALSAVWNCDRWFVGGGFKMDAGFVYSHSSTLTNTMMTFEAKAGWRFSLW